MYQQAAQKVPFGQTFGGQLLANTIGTAGGVLIAGAIQGNGNQNIRYGNNQWNGGYNQVPVRYFNDSNQPVISTNTGTGVYSNIF
jgi:hypothetical protein